MNWLTREARGRQIVKLIFICLVVNFVLNFISLGIFAAAHISVPSRTNLDFRSLPVLYIQRAINAFSEEIKFRLFPLAIVVEIGWSIKRILIVAAASSLIFGYIHGGWPCIFLQGIGGFLYCLLFLKCGGYQKKFGQALAVTIMTHFLFNAILITAALLLGVTRV